MDLKRIDTTWTHPDDWARFHKYADLAYKAATNFGLDLRSFEAKRRPLDTGALGLCYVHEKRISIVFRYKTPKTWGGSTISTGGWHKHPRTEDSIRHTVAHELAHLRYIGHNAMHKALTKRIDDWLIARLAELAPPDAAKEAA